MKCTRPNCTRIARWRGICRPHYYNSVNGVAGFVDGTATRERIALLRSRGYGWEELAALTGRSDEGLRKAGARVQAGMEQAVLAVPVPEAVEPAGGLIPSLGTIRRLQALAVAGWPYTHISLRVGMGPRYMSNVVRNNWVQARTARMIADVFDELQLTPGPSDISRQRARAKGWAPPLSWDLETIDDPDAVPDLGECVHTTAAERIQELHDLGVRDIYRIAERLRIKPESVQRELYPSRSKRDEEAA